ncbi:glycosyltransferase family 4 protein [Enterovibrio norvegicus]|uniref:glycosyltransferase family 4 protein n=1 Tax=Enterovibrio norvegicus TaxID=188144 RepID=UPI000C823581|nr:glycosyltransferase family 4 protein [Enterovibrio norvegicus]PMN70658.1 glycosyltransferase [Enterovibrio norvegicus]
MSRLTHIVILDPIAFAGGSKVSTKHVLSQLESQEARVTILTADPETWASSQAYVAKLHMPKRLEMAEQGLGYFARHILIAMQLLWLRLFVGQMHTALGASGPGVDLGLYLVKALLGYRLVQMIHGPVATSRTIGRCLNTADNVFYLDATQPSLSDALKAAGHSPDVASHSQFQPFRNGLPKQSWPRQCQYDYAVMFWAASLLKWKGLDTFTAALSQLTPAERPESHVCYIRPKQSNLPTSEAPQTLSKVFWHHAPENLDEIRAGANIFVSTSTKEPFGLSILEAMAAGMCVIIPSDDAFWDRQLTANQHCLKYQPDDVDSLIEAIQTADQNMQQVKAMGQAASTIALQYRADLCFAAICESLLNKSRQVMPELVSKEQ